MFELTRMPGAFGAFVDGIHLREHLSQEIISVLVHALYEHHILVIRGQEDLDEHAYVQFGRLWGSPIEFFIPEHRHSVHPELIRIHNSTSTPEDQRDPALDWHADSSYEPIPASTTMLYAIEAPHVGGETLFADMAAAYESLSQTMQKQLARLQVRHLVGGGKVAVNSNKRNRDNRYTGSLPEVLQPLVITHPVRSRKALYAISGSACGIKGMPDSEAIALLHGLLERVAQPRFLQRAKAEPKSVLIWDNFSVMHRATPTAYSDEEGERRVLHRISTRGLPALCGQVFQWPPQA
jgi:taurine dioxygenase